MKRDSIPLIDARKVPERQEAIHRRLENWAAYVIVRYPRVSAPMWRFMRSGSRMWHTPNPVRVVDERDGHVIERAIGALPRYHAEALRWAYVFRGPPARVVRELGISYDTLERLVIDGRSMLINCADDTHACGTFSTQTSP